jgi:hypothetical protein
MDKHQKHKALAHVRGAIHGWSFADVGTLQRKIIRAEAERDKVPAELRTEADLLIKPLRAELRRYV